MSEPKTMLCTNADAPLKGQVALVKDHPTDPDMVLAQFSDTGLEYNGTKMGFGWHAMVKDAFEEIVYDFDYQYNADGKSPLVLKVLTDHGRDLITRWKEMTGDERTLLNMIFDHIGAQLCTIEPALTEAPIITTDCTYNYEKERWEIDPKNPVWHFPNYQVEDCIETLLRDGQVTFARAPK